MKNLKLQWIATAIFIVAVFVFSSVSHAEDSGVGVTGFKWLKMSEKYQQSYVEGVLDGFVYAFGVTGDNQLGWSLKYIHINMKWDLFMDLIKKHFKEHPGQVHNVMVAAIKDALENGVPDVQEDEYDDNLRPQEEVPIMEDR
ncbi:MAG: hypothetical protein ACE5EN_01675 [Nitrospinota bacterium]